MDLLLVLLALCAVLLAVRLVRARRRGPAMPGAGRRPSDDPPGRGADERRPADARGAVSRHRWMLGGGGSGG